jgi:hypothetical protein
VSIEAASTVPYSISSTECWCARDVTTRPKSPPFLAARGEDVTRPVVSGLRAWLVVCPGRATKVRQAARGTLAAHDHIREVDRPAQVALTAHHGCGNKLDARPLASVHGVNMLKPADHAQLRFTAVQQALMLLPGDLFRWRTVLPRRRAKHVARP